MIKTCPVCKGSGCYCKKGENLESPCEVCYGQGFVADTAEEWEAEKLNRETEFTFRTYEIKHREVPFHKMKHYLVYSIFPNIENKLFWKTCVFIESMIRYIIRKPVKETTPKFEIGKCVCCYSDNFDKELEKRIDKEIEDMRI